MELLELILGIKYLKLWGVKMNYKDISKKIRTYEKKIRTYEKKVVIKAMYNDVDDIVCNTASGKQICHKGDYLVCSNGEFYPVKKKIFLETYKEVIE